MGLFDFLTGGSNDANGSNANGATNDPYGLNALMGGPNIDPAAAQNLKQQQFANGLLGLAAGMGSVGPSRYPITWGQVIGAGAQGLLNATAGTTEQALKAAQIADTQSQTQLRKVQGASSLIGLQNQQQMLKALQNYYGSGGGGLGMSGTGVTVGQTPGGPVQVATTPASSGGSQTSDMSNVNDPRGMASYITAGATARGIDPNTALRVASNEGLGNPIGDGGTSFGSFQLHTGGGLGDDFRKATGLDPSDLANEKATIDFALDNAAKNGWKAFNGARDHGIGRWQGIKQAATPTGGLLAASTNGAPPEYYLGQITSDDNSPTPSGANSDASADAGNRRIPTPNGETANTTLPDVAVQATPLPGRKPTPPPAILQNPPASIQMLGPQAVQEWKAKMSGLGYNVGDFTPPAAGQAPTGLLPMASGANAGNDKSITTALNQQSLQGLLSPRGPVMAQGAAPPAGLSAASSLRSPQASGGSTPPISLLPSGAGGSGGQVNTAGAPPQPGIPAPMISNGQGQGQVPGGQQGGMLPNMMGVPGMAGIPSPQRIQQAQALAAQMSVMGQKVPPDLEALSKFPTDLALANAKAYAEAQAKAQFAYQQSYGESQGALPAKIAEEDNKPITVPELQPDGSTMTRTMTQGEFKAKSAANPGMYGKPELNPTGAFNPYAYNFAPPAGTPGMAPGTKPQEIAPSTDHPSYSILPPVSQQTKIRGSAESLGANQKDWSTMESTWNNAQNGVQQAQQRVNEIAGIMKQFQTGSYAENFSDITAKMQALGLMKPGTTVNSPADMQKILKDNFASAMATMAASGLKRWTQSELAGASKNFANPDLQPGANHAIISDTLGQLNQQQAMMQDWAQAKNAGWANPGDFERAWMAHNPLQRYVDAAKVQIGPFKGMTSQEVKQAMPEARRDQSGALYHNYNGKWYPVGNGGSQ